MNNNIDINKLTITELKALAYDQLKELTRVQQNLQVIEARIIELEKEQNGTAQTEDTK